ncbi:nucleotide exchange factor GrpE [Nocardioides convexus]|uniref:nucleotide exchange factor GrpE n=1 Tax=Nocardioides convexus TaxID=2712224 RepID=UPI00241856E8|nr:nucleotide exchange factor GrpE [Nocardioides convexus]
MTEENLTPEGEQPDQAAPSPEGEPAAEAEPAAEEATPEADEPDGHQDRARGADPGPAATAGRVPQLQAPGRAGPGGCCARTRRTPRWRRSSTCSTRSTGRGSTSRSRAASRRPPSRLERVVSGLGLVKFGAPGDAFDPTVHEALSHIGTDPEVEVTTCKVVAKAGYKIGERVVRAAQVLVVDPVEG